MANCAYCKDNGCRRGEFDNVPQDCPSKGDIDARSYYSIEENYKLAHNSALVEAEGYCKKTRLEEIMEFARKCGYNKLGLAFCTGFRNEANIFVKILKSHGFEVVSVMCKNGSIPKEVIDIEESQKVRPGTYEPMCNPIGQALVLNEENTELNIAMGLCVGHDSLFFKYSKAPVTVFAVKDRVLAHNPLGAIYLSESYYNSKLYKKD